MNTIEIEDDRSIISLCSGDIPLALIKKETDLDESAKPQVSVKEMIKHYNTVCQQSPANTPTPGIRQISPTNSARQTQKQQPQQEPHQQSQNSSYSELGNYNDFLQDAGESMMTHCSSGIQAECANCCDKSAKAMHPDIGEYIADHTRRTTRSPSFSSEPCVVQFLATGGCQMSSRQSSTVILNKHNSDFKQPVHNCYESKTVISKTNLGVRITIDILFDDHEAPLLDVDMINSRIQTDIPESRILQEFQEQAKLVQDTNKSDAPFEFAEP